MLWWHGTPSIHGLGDWLTNAGRITGLLAGYGVVVLVALMARLPPIERGVGADRLARWHAMGGRYTVGLVVAHALLITWGYAVTAHTGVVSQTNDAADELPGRADGDRGAACCSSASASARRGRRAAGCATRRGTTCTSTRTWRSRSRSATSSPIGAQFMTNTAGPRRSGARMYAGVAAAILWYRFVTPARQAVRHRMRVLAVQQEAPGVVSS